MEQDNRQPKVVAVIQARMGSSRFPGKMTADLAGHPLIYHILQRTLAVASAQERVLATTCERRDDPLAETVSGLGFRVVRGPEENVLQRFLMAVETTQADYVVRICGDAPLFDPGYLDGVVKALLFSGADLAVVKNARRFPHQGGSVISARALRWSAQVAPEDPLAYEHVDGYAASHAHLLKSISIDVDPDLVPEFRLSIDTPEDLEVMRRIYARLYRPGSIVSLREVVHLAKSGEFELKHR
jgi:spore coat polysaccharide biosynthesis protein SpsF